jgi:tannase
MRSTIWSLAAAASAIIVDAATLDDVCTQAYVQDNLPADGFYPGVTINAASVAASPQYNISVSDQSFFPDGTFDYCNVTFAYSRDGTNDKVLVNYWLPSPDKFENRYLSTGGGGLAINSGTSTNGSLPGGILYGATAGLTDGGFGSFETMWDAVFLLANDSINWDSVYSFGYKAQNELATLGKELTKQFFNMSDNKLYSYYQGCSEGGREGWSQVQRFADEFDGAAIGAPAFRYSFQQVNHLYSNVVEQTLGYYPSNCEFEAIVNATLEACDPMDGRTDGVVSRTDLCKLNFDLNSTIGTAYYCAADAGGAASIFGGTTNPSPAQNGTISAEAVEVAKTIIDGLHDSNGGRIYLSYQPAATFEDATTQYNSETSSWEINISSLGGEWVARYLELTNSSTLDSLDGVTYDTLKDWMLQGWQMYDDSLQTNWPDLTSFNNANGKVLHFHGESDNSIPTASSVRYYDSVRSIMYPNMSFNDSTAALNDWYKLFLVPGAAHCGTNDLQPNGPFPQTNLAVLIDWVENGVEPVTLNATTLQGESKGEQQQICGWPLRPYWTDNGTTMECQYDQASIDSWLYEFDGIKMPVY